MKSINAINSGIYKIQSVKKPERFYIGSCVNFRDRSRNHIKDLKRNSHHSNKLQNHFNKYGIDDLQFYILLECDKNELLIKEQYYINLLNPFFNICKIAGSPLGVKRSEDTKNKLRKFMIGKISTFKGRHHSEETKQKLREINLGKKHSNETKNKCREAMKNYVHTPEHCKNISIAKQNMTSETKRKISEAKRNKIPKAIKISKEQKYLDKQERLRILNDFDYE